MPTHDPAFDERQRPWQWEWSQVRGHHSAHAHAAFLLHGDVRDALMVLRSVRGFGPNFYDIVKEAVEKLKTLSGDVENQEILMSEGFRAILDTTVAWIENVQLVEHCFSILGNLVASELPLSLQNAAATVPVAYKMLALHPTSLDLAMCVVGMLRAMLNREQDEKQTQIPKGMVAELSFSGEGSTFAGLLKVFEVHRSILRLQIIVCQLLLELMNAARSSSSSDAVDRAKMVTEILVQRNIVQSLTAAAGAHKSSTQLAVLAFDLLTMLTEDQLVAFEFVSDGGLPFIVNTIYLVPDDETHFQCCRVLANITETAAAASDAASTGSMVVSSLLQVMRVRVTDHRIVAVALKSLAFACANELVARQALRDGLLQFAILCLSTHPKILDVQMHGWKLISVLSAFGTNSDVLANEGGIEHLLQMFVSRLARHHPDLRQLLLTVLRKLCNGNVLCTKSSINNGAIAILTAFCKQRMNTAVQERQARKNDQRDHSPATASPTKRQGGAGSPASPGIGLFSPGTVSVGSPHGGNLAAERRSPAGDKGAGTGTPGGGGLKRCESGVARFLGDGGTYHASEDEVDSNTVMEDSLAVLVGLVRVVQGDLIAKSSPQIADDLPVLSLRTLRVFDTAPTVQSQAIQLLVELMPALAARSHEDGREAIDHSEVSGPLLQVMVDQAANVDVQVAGCRLFAALLKRSETVAAELVTAVAPLTLVTMDLHATDDVLLKHATEVLEELSSHPRTRPALLKHPMMLETSLFILRANVDNADLCGRLVSVLGRVFSDAADAAKESADDDAYDAFDHTTCAAAIMDLTPMITASIDVLRKHGAVKSVAFYSCDALANLTNTKRNRVTAARLGSVKSVVLTLRNHVEAVQVVRTAVHALANLSVPSENKHYTTTEDGLLELLLLVAKEHSTSSPVVARAAWAMASLAQHSDELRNKLADAAAGFLISAMNENSGSPAAVEYCLKALSAIAQLGSEFSEELVSMDVLNCIDYVSKKHRAPNVMAGVGELAQHLCNDVDIGLLFLRYKMCFTSLMHALRTQLDKSDEVALGAVETVRNISVHSELRVEVLGKGAFPLIVRALRKHWKADKLSTVATKIVIGSCAGLANLVSSDEGMGQFIHEQIIPDMIAAMRRHISQPEIIEQYCLLLGNACSRDVNVRAAFGGQNSQEHCGLFVDILKIHFTRARVLAPATALLFNLTATDDQAHKLHLMGATKIGLQLLGAHPLDAKLQTNTLYMLLNLSFVSTTHTTLVRNYVVEQMRQSVANHPASHSLRASAIGVLRNIATRPDAEERMVAQDVIPMVTKVLQERAGVPELTTNCLGLVFNLTRSGEHVRLFVENDGVMAVGDSVEQLLKYPLVVENGLGCLRHFFRHASLTRHEQANGTLNLTVRSMSKHFSNPVTLSHGAAAIDACCVASSQASLELLRFGGSEVLVNAMVVATGKGPLVASVMKSILSFTQLPAANDAVTNQKGAKVAMDVLARHKTEPEVAAVALALLKQLCGSSQGKVDDITAAKRRKEEAKQRRQHGTGAGGGAGPKILKTSTERWTTAKDAANIKTTTGDKEQLTTAAVAKQATANQSRPGTANRTRTPLSSRPSTATSRTPSRPSTAATSRPVSASARRRVIGPGGKVAKIVEEDFDTLADDAADKENVDGARVGGGADGERDGPGNNLNVTSTGVAGDNEQRPNTAGGNTVMTASSVHSIKQPWMRPPTVRAHNDPDRMMVERLDLDWEQLLAMSARAMSSAGDKHGGVYAAGWRLLAHLVPLGVFNSASGAGMADLALTTIRLFSHDSSACENALEVLGYFSDGEETRAALDEPGGTAIEAIVECARQHSKNAGLLGRSLCVLALLAQSPSHAVAFRHAGGAPVALEAMSLHPFDSLVCANASGVLANMASGDSEFASQLARDAQATARVLRLMQDHIGESTVQCSVLSNMVIVSRSSGVPLLLARSKALGIVLTSMFMHGDEAGVQEPGCELVGNIVAEVPGTSDEVVEEGGIGLLQAALMTHVDDCNVQCSALTAFWKLSWADDSKYITNIIEAGIAVLAGGAMIEFDLENREVNASALMCIAELGKHTPTCLNTFQRAVQGMLTILVTSAGYDVTSLHKKISKADASAHNIDATTDDAQRGAGASRGQNAAPSQLQGSLQCVKENMDPDLQELAVGALLAITKDNTQIHGVMSEAGCARLYISMIAANNEDIPLITDVMQTMANISYTESAAVSLSRERAVEMCIAALRSHFQHKKFVVAVAELLKNLLRLPQNQSRFCRFHGVPVVQIVMSKTRKEQTLLLHLANAVNNLATDPWSRKLLRKHNVVGELDALCSVFSQQLDLYNAMITARNQIIKDYSGQDDD